MDEGISSPTIFSEAPVIYIYFFLVPRYDSNRWSVMEYCYFAFHDSKQKNLDELEERERAFEKARVNRQKEEAVRHQEKQK